MVFFGVWDGWGRVLGEGEGCGGGSKDVRVGWGGGGLGRGGVGCGGSGGGFFVGCSEGCCFCVCCGGGGEAVDWTCPPPSRKGGGIVHRLPTGKGTSGSEKAKKVGNPGPEEHQECKRKKQEKNRRRGDFVGEH